MSTQVLSIQRNLKARCFDPGPLDGIAGRKTIQAIKRFQAWAGLKTDGIAGPATLRQLFGDKRSTANDKPAWFSEAERLKGIREVAGAKHNPTIIGWAKKLGGWVASFYTADETPWCGLFVAHCLGLTLPAEPLPSNPLSALAWAKFGNPITVPSVGAILVFKRDGGGHVGFYVGEDDDAYHVLGGNQSNSVSITRVAKSRLVAGGIRWPTTAPASTGLPVILTRNGSLSQNEA